MTKNKMEGQNHYRSSLTDLIDDAKYRRFDKRRCISFYGQYVGEEERANVKAKALRGIVGGMKENRPGFRLQDKALHGAAWLLHGVTEPECPGPNKPNVGIRSWTRVSRELKTPQELGVSKYSGEGKEAAKIVRRVAKNFGASKVGITGLDKRHVYQYDCDGKEIVFEPVEDPYETERKRVIPEKCKYVVVMLLQMSAEAIGCAPSPISSMVPYLSYNRIDLLTGSVAEFIRGLGYTAIPSANDTAINGPLAMEAGLGELCRMDKVMTPEFGPMIRICKVFTDLPMELDQRRKFGITEFCKVCRRCVEACPVRCINNEREPSFEVPGPWVSPGHKTWHGDNLKCKLYMDSTGGGCGICLHVCPWNKPKGILHTLVKGIINRTSIFNRFFVAADKLLGYGQPLDPETWWDLDLPPYGIDNRR